MGRHPAALDLLDHRPARAGAAARPPGDARGRSRASTTRSRSISTAGAPAHPGLPVADLGHLPRPRSRWPTPARRRTTRPCASPCDWMLVEGGHPHRRLAPHPAPRPAGRLVVRVRERVVPRHRRHRRGADRPAPRRPPALAPGHPARRSTGCSPCRARNGGWGAFDVDNDRRVMTQLPLCDFGEVIDPPTEDVTAHVVEALVECGVPRADPAVRRGRGLPLAHPARRRLVVGALGRQPHLRHRRRAARPRGGGRGHGRAGRAGRAVAWLAEHQNPDGGLGRERPRATPTRSGSAAASRPPPRRPGPCWRCTRPAPAHPAVEGGLALPGAHPAPRRLVGRGALHRHRVPDGLHDPLPPLPPGVPRERPRAARSDEPARRSRERARRPAARRSAPTTRTSPSPSSSPPGTCAPTWPTVYWFCRTTDDIGDEGPGGPAERLAALDALEARPRARALAGGERRAGAGGPGRRDRAAAGSPPTPSCA